MRPMFLLKTHAATLLQLISSVLMFHLSFCQTPTSKPLVPALIVFGDSIVDPGNNNLIKTIVKCNFPPYGIDFAGHVPTGRFSNGKIPTDFIASTLGLKEYLPAYVGTNLGAEDLLTGVSFASGGCGFDPLTSKLASVISMPEQLEMFKEYKEKIKAIGGDRRAGSIVSDSLYIVCAGSDDVANTYYTSPFRRSSYDETSYANLMLQSASTFLEDLIQQGAKKIGVVGIPPIGCVPSQRTLNGGILRSCAPGHNRIATLYNSKLAEEIARLNAKQHDQQSRLVFIDIYHILLDMIQQPTNYGFEVSTKGCCGTGDLEVSVLCNGVTSTVCSNVSNFVFFDSFHPTQRAYSILVDWLLKTYLPYLLY